MSVAADRTPAGFLPFQHPRLVACPPAGEGWRHEVKLDGYRMELVVGPGRGPTWYSRNGHDWSGRLPDFAEDARALGPGVYDGELCALDAEGSPVFSELRSAMGRRETGRVVGDLTFFAFDMLADATGDLRARPLAERRARLEAAVRDPASRIRLAGDLPGGGRALLEAACRLQLEGIVSKQLNAPYQGGARRLDSWVKAKCRPAQEVVIGGWEMTDSRFRSLLVGTWEDGRFTYAGAIGTGFGARVVGELLPQLRRVEAKLSPFEAGAPPRSRPSIHWTRPELVAAAEIAEWTSAGQLRQASFKGLREDKPAHLVTRERPAPPARDG